MITKVTESVSSVDIILAPVCLTQRRSSLI